MNDWGLSRKNKRAVPRERSNTMLRIIVGVFIVLHGVVHLLYFGHSRRLFEIQPGLAWPAGSWVFSRFLGEELTRWLAAIACIVAALGFVAAGAAILLRQAWWNPVVVAAAVFSAALVILFWDGKMQKLDSQGGIALLINLAILVALLVFRWPDFGF
jgi:hypothetical protein